MKMFLALLCMVMVSGCTPSAERPEVPRSQKAEAEAPPSADDPAAGADFDPALFLVADEDTKIYLFGTIHLLGDNRSWFDEAVADAFAESDELVLETVAPPAEEAGAIVMAKAIDPKGTPLSAEMSPEGFAKLKAELEAGGIPAASFEPMDPWFAALNLSLLQYQRLGLNPANGAEKVLEDTAKAEGKTVAGLESFEWQMDLFDTLPQDAQIRFLELALDDLENAENVITGMVATWARGDLDGLTRIINEGFYEEAALRERLLTGRNASWAIWIDERLERPGIVFMAVGAGHLGGAGSLQDQLAERGIAVERIVY